MRLGRIFYATLFLVASHYYGKAQVQFLLDLDPNTEIYTVSMLPEVTWKHPYNRTATAQITLKAPTGLFDLDEFMSLTPGVEWLMNSRVNSPAEAPAYDYLSFTLITTGLEPLEFTSGKPTKLFCFKNLTPDCSGEVALMNNKNDAFLPPNSRNVNVGNSIGVHGARGEAYTGNVSDKAYNCNVGKVKAEEVTPILQTVHETIELETQIFPNPTNNLVNIAFSWNKTEGDKQVLVYNSIGELAQFSKEKVTTGANQLSFDVSTLPSGIYNLILVEEGERVYLGKMMKVK